MTLGYFEVEVTLGYFEVEVTLGYFGVEVTLGYFGVELTFGARPVASRSEPEPLTQRGGTRLAIWLRPVGASIGCFCGSRLRIG